MTLKEFTERTGLHPTEQEYSLIEDMYMTVENMDKDVFCNEYKKHGRSLLVAELFAKAEKRKNKLKAMKDGFAFCQEKIKELAYLLIGKACACKDTDLYEQAVNLIGKRDVVVYKLKAGLPLWEEDTDYIDNNLK